MEVSELSVMLSIIAPAYGVRLVAYIITIIMMHNYTTIIVTTAKLPHLECDNYPHCYISGAPVTYIYIYIYIPTVQD